MESSCMWYIVLQNKIICSQWLAFEYFMSSSAIVKTSSIFPYTEKDNLPHFDNGIKSFYALSLLEESLE